MSREEQSRLTLDSAVLTRRTGLHLPAQLPFTTWHRIGRQLSLVADSSSWWLGDWLVYGASQYADRYKQAIKETSLDYKTLRNYAWVARRFPMPRRRERLSFQHHAEVAALPEPEQDVWLDRATQNRWTRNQLRRQLRHSCGRDGRDTRTVVVVLQVRVASEQERRWQDAATRLNRSLARWMTHTLDQAAREVLEAAEPDPAPPSQDDPHPQHGEPSPRRPEPSGVA